MNKQERKFSPVLASVLETKQVETPEGKKLDLVANIGTENQNALYDFISSEKPETVVEIGMAYGVSTMTILSALQNNGRGRLISIDPYVGWPTGLSVALHQIQKAGFSDIHQHLHERSQIALPRLWQEGFTADLVYIDGFHNFEYAFTDFFFADKIVREKGVVVFNDCGWKAVFKVLKFLKSHRRYDELPLMMKQYCSRNLLFSLIRRIEGRCGNDRYFRKIEDWEPDSGFFRNF